MNNQEFQAVLQSLPAGFDIVVNGSSYFDVKGHFEIKDGCTKGVIHITDMFAAKANLKKAGDGAGIKHPAVQTKKPLDLSRHKVEVREAKDKITADIIAGMSFDELRAKYGISHATYYRYSQNINVSAPERLKNEPGSGNESGEAAPSSLRKKSYKVYGPGEKEEMIKDINSGVVFKEINKKYGICRNTYGRLKQKGPTDGVKISEEIREKIKTDIKLGLFTPQILKKYRINVPTLAAIKKSIKAENSTPTDAGSEDDLEAVKKRLDYGRSINNDADKIPAAGMLKGIAVPVISVAPELSIDINKIQEKAAKDEALVKLKPAARPDVRNWQANMIARGL